MYHTYLVQFSQQSRQVYNLLTRLPGVLDYTVLDIIESDGLADSRDGHALYELLAAAGSFATVSRQDGLAVQCALVHEP